jgi:hypothetical protein
VLAVTLRMLRVEETALLGEVSRSVRARLGGR